MNIDEVGKDRRRSCILFLMIFILRDIANSKQHLFLFPNFRKEAKKTSAGIARIFGELKNVPEDR
jgi:hypothetical protein